MTSMVGLEIHEAASLGDLDALEELINSGKFDVNLGDLDWGNKTPLHWACQKGFAECVRLLLDNGARGSVTTDTGWTPAHFAAESGRIVVLRALHACHVRVDKKDNYGCTPRRLAEIYNHQDCVKFLQQAELEIAERRRNLGLLNSSDEEDDLDTVTTVSFATDERSTDEVVRSSSRHRRRKDRVVSPAHSEGRKSKSSDTSSLANEKKKFKNKNRKSPSADEEKRSKNKEVAEISAQSNSQKKPKKSKARKTSPAQNESPREKGEKIENKETETIAVSKIKSTPQDKNSTRKLTPKSKPPPILTVGNSKEQ